MLVDILLTALLSICGGLLITLTSMVIRHNERVLEMRKQFDKDMTALRSDVSKSNNEVQSNYLERFEKMYYKMDKITLMMSEIKENQAAQTAYCKAVQEKKLQ